MTALTEDFSSRTKIQSPRKLHFPVRALNQAGAPIKINIGDLVVRRRATNLAEVAEDANPRTDLIPCGIAECAVDMTGKANGDVSVFVLAGGWGEFDTGAGADEITDNDIGQIAFIKNNNTLHKTNGGGTLSPCGPIMFGDGARDADGISVWIDPELSGIIGTVAATQAATSNLQSGTGVLVAGVSAPIPAIITATSKILITAADSGASPAIGRLDARTADRVVGAPGSFIVRSFDALNGAETDDTSTFNWLVIG